MPIHRYRDAELAREDLWLSSSDPRLPVRIRRLWALSLRLAPRDIPRGLRKFRSIEEANEEREAWVLSRVRAIAASQQTPGDRGRPEER